ncbi:MAG: hypothetical protein ACLTCB_03625 [Merdibacter sp.]
MREYVAPRMTGETFAANEYIAACWGVACDTGWANWYEQEEGDYGHGVTHDSAHCGNSSNQVIFDDNGDNIGDRMIETGTAGLGDLVCSIFLDEHFTRPRDVSSVKVGDTIYWTTTASDGRTWNHRGTVTATAEGHPNRS